MSRPTVYLDLDRTLFQTARAYELWEYLESRYPERINAHVEIKRRNQFYSWTGDMYFHDVSAQLRDLGFNPSKIYRELASSPLADGRFEFAGCQALIEYLAAVAKPVVLTYGTDDYQKCKAALCPALKGMPIETTRRPKPEWLAEHHASGWLIDDKAIGDQLPPNISFIQVGLEGRPADSASPWPCFYTLAEVEDYLRHRFAHLQTI